MMRAVGVLGFVNFLVACTDAKPATLDFGVQPKFDAVLCGTSHTEPFELGNTGDEPLHFELTTTLANVTITPQSGTIAPGDSTEVMVTASTPARTTAGSTATGTLFVISNDAIEPMRSLPLAVTTGGATLTVDTSDLELGNVAPYTNDTRYLRLAAAGTEDVKITFNAPRPQSGYLWNSGDLTLRPGARVNLPIFVSIDGPGVYVDQLEMDPRADLCNAPTTTVSLFASVD